MTPAQRDLLTLVNAMKAASAKTETANLSSDEDEFLMSLGEILAYQIKLATLTAKTMERYAMSHDRKIVS